MKKILILLLFCGFWANAQQYHDKGAKFEFATNEGDTITVNTRIPIIDEFGLINYYVDVADLLALNPAPVLEWGNITGTLYNQTDLQGALNDKADQSALTAHTSNGNIHFTQSAISITESQVSDLKDYLRGDINDTNGSNKLTLGSLEVTGQTILQNGLNMSSVPVGTSDNILTLNQTTGDVEQRVFSLGDIDIANAAGTNQFPIGLGDQLRFEGSGDTSISFDGVTNTVTITSVPGSGGGGAVTTFNGRDGAVVSQAGDYSTAMVNENTNLYFTEPRVRATPLTGLTISNTPISSTNTFIQALGRLQGQINDRITGSYTGFDSRYVNVTGDAMSGQLSISSSGLDAISVDQSNTNTGAYIRNSGSGRAMIVRSNGGDLIQFRNDLNQEVATIESGGTVRTNANLHVGGTTVLGSGLTSSPLRLNGTGTGDSNTNTITFNESDGSTRQAFLGFYENANSNFVINNERAGSQIILEQNGGVNGFRYYFGGSSTQTVYHSGNLRSNADNDARYYTKGQSDNNYVKRNDRTDGGYAWIRYSGTGSPFYATNQGTGDLARFLQGSGDGIVKARISNNGGFYLDGDIVSQGVVAASNLSGNNTGDQIAGTGLSGTSTLSVTNIAAGSSASGALRYNGNTKSAGRLYGGSSNPSNTTRLNYDGNLYVSNLTSIGDVIANSSSDRRLKDDIRRIENPLKKISKLTGNEFKWNDKQETYDVGQRDYGVLAQEVRKVLPHAVDRRDNGYLAVDYKDIIPLLIEAIKELQNEIKELKDEK